MDKVDITPAFLYWIANFAKEYLCDGRSIRCCGDYINECPLKRISDNKGIKCSELELSELLEGLRVIYENEKGE